jgi:hypothetical protein
MRKATSLLDAVNSCCLPFKFSLTFVRPNMNIWSKLFISFSQQQQQKAKIHSKKKHLIKVEKGAN